MADLADSNARLAELLGTKLGNRRLILASNRGPFEYHLDEEGKLCPRRGAGGVVSALSSLSRYIELDWVASAMKEGDRRAAEQAQEGRFKAPTDDGNLYLRFVVCPRSTYHKYYSVLCNPLLWFLQHYMWNCSRTPNIDSTVYDAWENGYVVVNQAFARAVVAEAAGSDRPPIVILNDYHLYLTAGYIRQQMPEILIQHFIHIPWPTPIYWQLLPRFMRQAIISSLCSADIVGLQTRRDVQSFLSCCQEFIDRAVVDRGQQTVSIDGRVTRVRAYPISVDVAGLKEIVASGRLAKYEEKLSPLCGEQTIVRVDRVEPSKNIIRGFKAFATLLERYPRFVGRIKFLAFMVPSRTHLRPYQRYTQDAIALIEEINNKYGNDQWHPIDYFYENNFLQALAGMRGYDVLLVNSVIDGMNLIAKEGPTINERDGVLILSETVGAYEQLGEYALVVAPADIEGTVQALYRALTMPADEKRRRALALKESIKREDLSHWLCRLLEDVIDLVKPPAETAI